MTNPWERLTEEDINNVKHQGNGCLHFLLSVLASVLATLATLDFFGFLNIWK
jgi:hypothetical protein